MTNPIAAATTWFVSYSDLPVSYSDAPDLLAGASGGGLVGVPWELRSAIPLIIRPLGADGVHSHWKHRASRADGLVS